MGGAWDELRDAAADRDSGAAEIARRAAVALAALPRQAVPEAVRVLVTGHPSMAPLWRLGAAVLGAEDHAGAALAFARAIAAEREMIAATAASRLRGTVVTLSWSSTLVAAVAAAGGPALCARSEPGGEGAVSAAWLRDRGVDARLVEDGAAIRAASEGVTAVVGADAVGPGGTVNKAKTGPLVEAAARAYAVAGTTKFVAEDLPLLERFERTPLEAFTGLITERGTLDPEEAAGEARRHVIPPPLRSLIRR